MYSVVESQINISVNLALKSIKISLSIFKLLYAWLSRWQMEFSGCLIDLQIIKEKKEFKIFMLMMANKRLSIYTTQNIKCLTIHSKH